jgi:predicted N-formylglutamate amidohydrolase
VYYGQRPLEVGVLFGQASAYAQRLIGPRQHPLKVAGQPYRIDPLAT